MKVTFEKYTANGSAQTAAMQVPALPRAGDFVDIDGVMSGYVQSVTFWWPPKKRAALVIAVRLK